MSPLTYSSARTPHLTGTTEGTVPFIGRTAVLRLAGLRVIAARGTVLTGPTGIGKSRTLREIEDAAERADLQVGRVAASRSTATVPFGAFLPLLPPDALDGAAGGSGLDAALIVRTAVLARRYDVIGVDDAHLLDDASAALLLDLARGGTTIVLVLDPIATAADAVLSVPEASRAESVELPPFSAEESAELLEAVLQGPVDGGTALELHEAAQGVPLVLRELLEALLRDGGVERSAGVWALTAAVPTPQPVQQRVLDRLRALDAGTRAWVELVAVAQHVPADLAVSLVEDDAADRAEVAGWVRLDQELQAYRLDHALDRQPVLSEIGSRARARALRTLLAGLESLDRPLTRAERIEVGRWRLELGERLSPDDALTLAASTSPADPALAERFLRIAATDDDPLALVALAQHLIASGAIAEAEGLLRRAARLGGQGVRVAALTALAVGLGDRRSGDALQDLEAALVDHPDEPDLLAVQVALLAAEARTADAVAVATRLAGLPDPGAGAVLGEVYGAVAMAVRGDQAAAVRMSDALRPLADQHAGALPEGPMLQAWLEAAVPWTGARDPHVAVEIAQRGYDRTLRTALRPDRARFAHLLAAGRLMQGDASLAVRLLREAEAAQCFWRDSRRPEIVANLVQALVLTGDQAGAEQTLERLSGMVRTPEQEATFELARASVSMGRGDESAAAETALSVGDAAAARGDLAAAADAWSDAVRYGSRAAAQHLLDQGDAPAGRMRDLIRAQAAAVVEHDAAALAAVAEQYWDFGVRLFALEAAATSARWSLQADDTVGSAAATERLLRWSVATPGLADPLADAVPLAGLTSREREIVRLAAAGLPDKGIAVELGISLRTAQTHLGRAFNKLGIHRRRELVRLLPRDQVAERAAAGG